MIRGAEGRPPLRRQGVCIPARIEVETAAGRETRLFRLDALLVSPSGPGPFPLAVINHGAPRNGDTLPRMLPQRMEAQARAFAERGWAALVLSRRGYGRSEGPRADGLSRACRDRNYIRAGRESAKDIAAAIRYLQSDQARTDLDIAIEARRVISVGVSAGGFATLALGAEPVEGLVALVNFAGGRGSDGDAASPDDLSRICQPERLIEAMARFGATSTLPALWVYAGNDRYFPPLLAQRMCAAYTRAGGSAELVEPAFDHTPPRRPEACRTHRLTLPPPPPGHDGGAPAFAGNGHAFFSTGIRYWTPTVFEFLRRHGLPG